MATEEEAKTKLCPFIWMSTVGYITLQRKITDEETIKNCQGSDCFFWDQDKKCPTEGDCSLKNYGKDK